MGGRWAEAQSGSPSLSIAARSSPGAGIVTASIFTAADSLCRLLEHTPQMTRIPVALLDQHVDAVRAIARERGRADLPGIADALTRRLREVTDEFLRVENSDRPDYLESILAPALVPAT